MSTIDHDAAIAAAGERVREHARQTIIEHGGTPEFADEMIAMATAACEAMNAMPLSGLELIEEERLRQLETEGYDSEHDAQHDTGKLWRAGVAYATGNRHWWPWDIDSYKPEAREEEHPTVRDLVKAGALIAAELDRLQRRDALTAPAPVTCADTDDGTPDGHVCELSPGHSGNHRRELPVGTLEWGEWTTDTDSDSEDDDDA